MEEKFYHGRFCLSDIPNEALTRGDDGKIYVWADFCARRDGADQYGNTHYLKVRVGQENVYLGNFKPSAPRTQGSAPIVNPFAVNTAAQAPAPAAAAPASPYAAVQQPTPQPAASPYAAPAQSPEDLPF